MNENIKKDIQLLTDDICWEAFSRRFPDKSDQPMRETLKLLEEVKTISFSEALPALEQRKLDMLAEHGMLTLRKNVKKELTSIVKVYLEGGKN